MSRMGVSRFVAMLPVVLLVACGDPKLDTGSFDKFTESYDRIIGTIEDPARRAEFELALKKVAAYSAFQVDSLDFSKGVVQVSVASVLPRTPQQIRETAFVAVGSRIGGLDAAKLIELAAEDEERLARRYVDRVDAGIASVQLKINAEEERKRQRLATIGRIGVAAATFGRDDTAVGVFVPAIDFTLTNATEEPVTRLDLRGRLVAQDGSVLIDEPFGMDLGFNPLQTGEQRSVRLRMGGQAWANPAFDWPQRYPIEVKVASFRSASGHTVAEASAELDALLKLRAELKAHREQAREAIAASFVQAPGPKTPGR